ncbi:MAG: lysoplasmalogenase [Hamadaea sp.]|uniref:lysoplasmalogenase n=1 Tax=Hamadaea sp. TaxID=2024425 RepID=UPI0017B3BA09|nr:lysoplasmalogenase [Hamadaea sp.]NUR72004.1 lysoplasmalogenase [Hamadaea sp.]NUT23035.1 lysoplasmalogenase [Hamadaea sp.]
MILVVYAVLAVTHIVVSAFDVTWAEWATKPLLMPLLALYVGLRKGPRLVVAALLLSAAGDVALQFAEPDLLFLVGMGFFGAAHVCYIAYFVRHGRRRLGVVPVYVLLWAGLIAWLWPDLGALQVPVAAYSLLLFTTGATSARLGLRAGLGGAFFVLSDTLIAVGLADHDLPGPDIWVMVTYALAQVLLATAVIGTHQSHKLSAKDNAS